MTPSISLRHFMLIDTKDGTRREKKRACRSTTPGGGGEEKKRELNHSLTIFFVQRRERERESHPISPASLPPPPLPSASLIEKRTEQRPTINRATYHFSLPRPLASLSLCLCSSCLTELNALSEGKSVSEVDGARHSAHVLFPCVTPGLSAASRLLLTPERSPDLRPRGADVHVHQTAVAAPVAGPSEHVLHRLGIQRRRQPLRNGVVQSDGFLEGGDLDEVQERSEYFLLHDRLVVADLTHCGLDEKPGPVAQGLPSAENLSPLGLGLLDGVEEPLPGSVVVERTAESALLQGVANRNSCVCLHEAALDLVVHLLVHEQPPQARAPLPTRPHCPEETPTDGQVQVRILHDHRSVVASKLQKHFPETLLDCDPDLAPSSAGTGEGDQVDSFVLRDLLPHTPVACAEDECPHGTVVPLQDPSDDLRQSQVGQGRRVCALPDVAVAADQGEGKVPSKRGGGEVECGDNAHIAERVVLLHEEVIRAL
mmetsp:Transcript_55836/g.109297  ORF Transcript_55836/g.109297 Transcript_55836/m.109297 type:complete len:484 (+) Transcript_55836:1199-2650(+)